ncbi:MAG: hypothetical protein R3E62_04015 [Pseudomonadales bacterium]
MVHSPNSTLLEFAKVRQLVGLTEPSLKAIAEKRAGYSVEKGRRFLAFQQRINSEMLGHRVITSNAYTAWFSKGLQSFEQVQAFIVQFSVFSNQFLVAQLQKMINADTLEGMRVSKEILANEIGVLFNSGNSQPLEKTQAAASEDAGPTAMEGSVDGGIFRFKAAHFEWLMRIADKLALGLSDVGRRCHGTPSTLFYCDELIRLYGNEDYRTSQATSYAVENGRQRGSGMSYLKGWTGTTTVPADLPLGFYLAWPHRGSSMPCIPRRNWKRFISVVTWMKRLLSGGGNEMLDGVMPSGMV